MRGPPLPWQDLQWQRLRDAHEKGRLAHGLLLTGPHGCGRRRFADALAANLLCNALDAEPACGNCRACLQLAAGTHPDHVQLAPAESGKSIGVEAVRDLVERMHLTAGNGTKVAVITPADSLTTSAANSLLKILEEPPQGAYLILISTPNARLPATVRSRCQRIAFTLPARAKALAWLAERGVDNGETWLSRAGGAPLLAEELAHADSGRHSAQADPVGELVAVLARRRSPAGAAAALLAVPLDEVVRAWILVIEDLIRLRQVPDAAVRLGSHHDTLISLVRQVDARALFDYLDQLYRSVPGPSSPLKPALQIQALLVAASQIVAHPTKSRGA